MIKPLQEERGRMEGAEVEVSERTSNGGVRIQSMHDSCPDVPCNVTLFAARSACPHAAVFHSTPSVLTSPNGCLLTAA